MQVSNIDLLTHHEAGHAAVAHIFGLRLRAVWIDVQQDSGRTELLPGEQPTRLQMAIILLAGGRAEKTLDPECLSHRLSTAQDEAALVRLVSNTLEPKLQHRSIEYVDSLGERIDQRLAVCCERLVVERWPAIQRLAAALKEAHEVTGTDAEALLSG